jgi:hypothetical protein
LTLGVEVVGRGVIAGVGGLGDNVAVGRGVDVSVGSEEDVGVSSNRTSGEGALNCWVEGSWSGNTWQAANTKNSKQTQMDNNVERIKRFWSL